MEVKKVSMIFVAIVNRDGCWTWTPIQSTKYREALRRVLTTFKGLDWEIMPEYAVSKRIAQLNGAE